MIRFCGYALMLSLLLPKMVMAEPNEFSCTPKHWCHITLNKQVCGKYTVGRMPKRLLFAPNQGVWLDTMKHIIDSRADGETVTSQHFTATHQFRNNTSEEKLNPGKQALLYKRDSKLISKIVTHRQTEISVFECTAGGS